MRKILFRGKRIDDKKWVEGYLNCALGTGGIPYICRLEQCKEENPNIFPVMHMIDPKTIGQYTSLTDKNDRMIFEGDIVDCHEQRGAAFYHGKIVWNEVKARFDVVAMECSFPMCLDDCEKNIFITGLDYEVIGNVFDNPEMI